MRILDHVIGNTVLYRTTRVITLELHKELDLVAYVQTAKAHHGRLPYGVYHPHWHPRLHSCWSDHP
ncbi:hypothetical protein MBAV_002224 [Candidatus Magnetobacterium bavaricum]|uniref:Uncharacterized protein n=1 Tax=Candidatus Magnetobacterium bavaricum TaxID=29290 RepID=A0A0F3GUN5_9BACT|nr:hypothetical protein MBAV_002224 [Candidatus Magnetobacterium bavaricum]